MSVNKYLEDTGVEVAYAEANAWSARPANNEERQGKTRGKGNSAQRKRAAGRAMLFGILSIVLYAAVFMNSETIMHLFTRGGVFAVLPVATVFAFSYAHGSFASNVWSALGIEASKKATARKTAPAEKRPAAPRPRVHA